MISRHPSGGVIGGYRRSTHSRGVLELRHYLSAQVLDATPPARDYASNLTFRWWLNDRLSCCTVASQYHRREMLAQLTGVPFDAADSDLIADYMAVSGWDGTYGDITDHGAMMIDVATRAREVGIAKAKIPTIARIDVGDLDQLRAAIDLFPGVWVGGDLPKALDEQGYDWTIPPLGQRKPDDEPDRDRGHAFLLTGYDHDILRVTTWAKGCYTATNDWWRACGNEVYVEIDDALATGARPAPNGFNLARLQADLAGLVP